jgi:decaprenylphospho-beta-D-ribofuranose 2-oxidase
VSPEAAAVSFTSALTQPLSSEWLSGWGGYVRAQSWRWRPDHPDELAAALASGVRARGEAAAGAVAGGRGRSYGDAAQRSGGLVIDTGAWTQIDLDPDAGTVVVGAGVSVGELLRAGADAGYGLPVVPGTQHVSVGGAIAADIHGKNHATLGTFSRHVTALGLVTSDGQLLELEGSAGDPRFEATTGGMGLTGVIAWAKLTLRPLASSMLLVDIDRARNMDEIFSLLDDPPSGEHRVAWVDLLCGREPRGVVTRAAHVEVADGTLRGELMTRPARAAIPEHCPAGLLRVSTVRAFNELRYRTAPRSERGAREAFGAHMFPLDVLDAWPRLYGPKGFVQYQFVVPRGAENAIRGVLAVLAAHDVPCYLAVLKDFGQASPGPLSFPSPGWTLAMDLPGSAPELRRALDRCDQLVADAGGRVYLAKDARLRPDVIRAMYPRLDEWRRTRDQLDPCGLWRSDLAARTGLLEDAAS